MANFFYIYEESGIYRRLKGMYVTQAKADSEAAGDVSLTANQGAVDIPDHISVGWVWDTSNSMWLESEVTELSRRKAAAKTLHNYLKGVTEGIHAVRHEKPQADVEKAEQFIAMAHWGNYVAAHMGMLIDNFETWVERMVEGAEHVSNTQELFMSVHGLDEPAIPTQACAWVSPIDQTTVEGLNMARNKSTLNTPAIATVATDGWFGGEVVELTDIHLGDGDWIRSLTA